MPEGLFKMITPKVSVILTSYNHGQFIDKAIASVLEQSFEDFELIVLDDKSTDNSSAKILGFDDSRIRFIKNDHNLGMVRNVNKGIRMANGDYIAHLNSDDIFFADKLKKQVKFLDENLEFGAVFTGVKLIDKEGANFTDEKHPYYHAFEKSRNQDRYQWLNYFFYNFNCLCYPSVMVRKTCYDNVGLFNPSYTIMLDYDMWIRICRKYQIHRIEEKLTGFRVSDLSASCSSDSKLINGFEIKKILRNYVSNFLVDELKMIFPNFNKSNISDLRYSILKSCFDLTIRHKALAAEYLLDLINSEEDLKIINDNNITLEDILRLRKEILSLQQVSFSKDEKQKSILSRFQNFLNQV